MSTTDAKDAQAAFDKNRDSFDAKKADSTCVECDDCAKCQEEMKKALQGKLYDKGVGQHSAQDLNDATITTFGELSPKEAKTPGAIGGQNDESEGIASMMFNRQDAAASGSVPKGSNFTPGGAPKTLSGVATAKGQFLGYKGGKKMLNELTKGKLTGEACRRQCQRWRASKKAVDKFANDKKELDKFNQDKGKFYYNRAVDQRFGQRTLDASRGEVRLGGTDFSGRPMGTDAGPDN